MQLARPVEVEDGVEGARVPVKEIPRIVRWKIVGGKWLLIVHEGVVRAEEEDFPVGIRPEEISKCCFTELSPREFSQTRVWNLFQHPPHHLVSVKQIFWSSF